MSTYTGRCTRWTLTWTTFTGCFSYLGCSKACSPIRVPSSLLISNPFFRHCSGAAPNQLAPWYIAGAGQAGSLSPSLHSVPGFSDPQHDILLALMDWVENGNAPTQIIATKWRNDTLQDSVLRQRPLCMYPKQAKYKGSGDPDDASSWECQGLY